MEGDAIYFSRRAADERRAAQLAAHEAARDAHLALAERYEDLAASIIDRAQRNGAPSIAAE